MAKLIPHNLGAKRKLTLRRAKVERQTQLEDQGQLNMFSTDKKKKLVPLKQFRYLNPFQEALATEDKDHEKAEKLYLESIQNGMAVPDAYCNLGVLYAGTGKSTEAINAFTNALANDPRHVESHYNLANLYFDIKNYALAIQHFKIALTIEPNFSEALFNLALAYSSMEQFHDAYVTMVKYVEDTPGSDRDALVLLHSLKAFKHPR